MAMIGAVGAGGTLLLSASGLSLTRVKLISAEATGADGSACCSLPKTHYNIRNTGFPR